MIRVRVYDAAADKYVWREYPASEEARLRAAGVRIYK
jgi:hypothetical protein